MNRSPLLKGITLTSFVLLIAAFVSYRSGLFDQQPPIPSAAVQTSPNGGAINTVTADSIAMLPDSGTRTIMSSSKSMILLNEQQQRSLDSFYKATGKRDRSMMSGSKSGAIFESASEQKKAEKERVMMLSSKSGRVFKPGRDNERDSILMDSIRKATPKHQR